MDDNQTESRAAFARRIGHSKAYVTKLVARGLPLTPDGKSVLIAAALTWIDGNVNSPDISSAGEKSLDLNEAKTRLALANAARVEFALEIERGRYVLADEVKRAARSFGRAHRDAMLGFANRFGAAIAARVGCDPVILIAELDATIRQALLEAVGIPVPFDDASHFIAEQEDEVI